MDIERAKEIKENLSYGIGIDSDRHTEILKHIGDKYSEFLLNSNDCVVVELKIYEYIKKNYSDLKEFYVAANMAERLTSSIPLRTACMIAYELKRT